MKCTNTIMPIGYFLANKEKFAGKVNLVQLYGLTPTGPLYRHYSQKWLNDDGTPNRETLSPAMVGVFAIIGCNRRVARHALLRWANENKPFAGGQGCFTYFVK